jgi:hypothetical protein
MLTEKQANRISHVTSLLNNMLRDFDVEYQMNQLADKESYVMLEDLAYSLVDSFRMREELAEVESILEDDVVQDIEGREDISFAMLSPEVREEVIRDFWSGKLD